MELKSDKQQYDTIAVTDIDIAFPGDLQTFTLRDGVDTYEENGEMLFMSLAGGELTFRIHLAHWWAIRHRTIRVAAQADQSGQSAVAAPPANTSSTTR